MDTTHLQIVENCKPKIDKAMESNNEQNREDLEYLLGYKPNENEIEAHSKYLTALQADNTETIAEMQKFGESARQILMNITDYNNAKRFGYTNFEIGEYGWMARQEWIETETIPFVEKKDKASNTYVKIAMGINGRWTNGYSLRFGSGCGRSSGCCFSGKDFATKDEAIEDVLNYAYNEFLHASTHSEDPTNYDKKYIQFILSSIKTQLLYRGMKIKPIVFDTAEEATQEPVEQAQEPKLQQKKKATTERSQFFSQPQLSLFGGTQLTIN